MILRSSISPNDDALSPFPCPFSFEAFSQLLTQNRGFPKIELVGFEFNKQHS